MQKKNLEVPLFFSKKFIHYYQQQSQNHRMGQDGMDYSSSGPTSLADQTRSSQSLWYDCHQLLSWAKDGQKWLLGRQMIPHLPKLISLCWELLTTFRNKSDHWSQETCLFTSGSRSLLSLVVWWGRKGIDQTFNVVKETDRDREKAVRKTYKGILSVVSRLLR